MGAAGDPAMSPSMFQQLWDGLPLAAFVRSREGQLIYANYAGKLECCCPVVGGRHLTHDVPPSPRAPASCLRECVSHPPITYTGANTAPCYHH